MLRAYSSPARFIIALSLIYPLKRSPLLSSSIATLHSSSAIKKSLLSTPTFPFQFHPFKATSSFCTTNSFDVGKEKLVQHLLVKEDDFQLLLELEKRALGGEDLSELAVEYSICPSKEEGGVLGWVRKGQMVPEFEEAAFSAPINKVMRCKTDFGWHLLQVLSEREESILEDIRPIDLHNKMDIASLRGFDVLPLGQLGTWGPEITSNFDPQKETYVLCHHGRRSLQVAKWLQKRGFRRVFNISGGIHEYALKVDPSIPTY